MELTADLGSKIINETKKLINENIIIVNKQAIIIASTDISRIGNYHEGAQQAIETNTITVLTSKHETRMKGIKPGVNMPIAINQKVIGVIGITGEPSEILPFASLMQKMTELLIQETIFIQETEWEARALEVFLLDWVQLDTIPADFIHRAGVLGIDYSNPIRCSLIHLDFQKERLHHINDLKDWLENTFESIVVRWGSDRLLMLTKESTPKEKKAFLQASFKSFQSFALSQFNIQASIGIGTVTTQKVIKPSYQKAEKALRVSMNTKSIVFYENLLLEICLDDVDPLLKSEFINRLISPLLSEPDLVNTLRKFLENNLHIKNTAADLHIHINTLHYRLNRIKEITTLNPKDTYSIASFYTAIYYLDEKTI